jgi:hypothetical protein
MALGFRDCCNQFSYFTLDSTPAFVSEFETYYIRTEQGLNFCAVYVNLPTLNYSPPVYSVFEMTQQANCADCIVTFPCAAQEVILVNEFVSGSVAQGTDCQIVTIPQIFVECQSTDPTTFNGEDGVVALVVSGAVAPYRFLIAGTESFLGFTQDENVYTIYDGVSAGTYSITVQDSNLDFSVTVDCVLNNPSQNIIIEPIVTEPSRNGASDGIIEFNITQGVPPYTILLNSQVVGTVIEDLVAGIYFFEISDQLTSQIITVEVTQPDPISYSPGLCMSFNLCGTLFNLNFTRILGLENLRPRYRCTNPTKIGLKELYIRWGIGFPSGWVTTIENVQPDDIQFETFPGECNLNDVRFAAAGPLGEQPTGTWLGTIGFMTGIFPIVTPGGCPPTVIVREPIGTYCPGPPVSLAEVILEGAGGSGGPYTFFYSTNGVNYTESSVGTLYLANGVYSAKVRDSDGIESLPTNFTVVTEINIFTGSQIGFCGIVDPTSPGVTGVLDRAINEGEYRDVDFTVTHYFDFSTMPEGTQFSGQLQLNVLSNVTSGDLGYGPIDKTEYTFAIEEAYYIQNGNRIDFLNTIINASSPFANVGALDVEGSTDLYSTNYGVYNSSSIADSCTASTETVLRSSPNAWGSCDFLYNDSSLIENDLRARNYQNNYVLRAGAINFSTETRMAIKMRVQMRSYMTPYIPEFLRQTDASTLLPTFYVTPEGFSGESLLNTPNVDNFKIGSEMFFQLNYNFRNLTLTQSPPSVRCFSLESNFGSFGKVGLPGSNFTQPRIFFSMKTGYGVSQPFGADETERYVDRILARNNTCSAPPDWAS